VLLHVRGVVSNRTSIPINSDPYACAHPLGISYGDLKTLDAGGTIPLGLLEISDNGAYFSVVNAGARVAAMHAGEQLFPEQRFTCIEGTFWPVGFERGVLRDVGSSVQLTGPNGRNVSLTLGDPPSSWEYRYQNFVPSSQAPVFAGGIWQVGAPGGADLASFFQPFFLPPVSAALNVKSGDTIASTQDLSVTWDATGFTAGSIGRVILNGDSAGMITCPVPAWTGRAQVPQAMLRRFAGKRITLGLAIVPDPSSRTIFPIRMKDGSPLQTVIDYTFIAAEVTVNIE
jgi:hypothetical protein